MHLFTNCSYGPLLEFSNEQNKAPHCSIHRTMPVRFKNQLNHAESLSPGHLHQRGPFLLPWEGGGTSPLSLVPNGRRPNAFPCRLCRLIGSLCAAPTSIWPRPRGLDPRAPNCSSGWRRSASRDPTRIAFVSGLLNEGEWGVSWEAQRFLMRPALASKTGNTLIPR